VCWRRSRPRCEAGRGPAPGRVDTAPRPSHTAATRLMVYHLVVEARRAPRWLTNTTRGEHAARLRAGPGPPARDGSPRWRDERPLEIRLRSEPEERHARAVHQQALQAVILAVDGAALHPAGAVVTRVVSHWTQGAIAGALTGLGLSTTQEDRLGP